MSFDFQLLADAINAQIAPVYHTTVIPVEYPSQGDFAWFYQNQNQVFNQWSLDYLSARVSPAAAPGLARLSPSGGFPNAYASLLSMIEYSPSSTDTARVAADGTTSATDTLEDEIAFAGRVLTQLIDNTCHPSDQSGGMRTVDPNDGTISAELQVGYQVSSSLAAIDNALSDHQHVMTVQLRGSDGSTITIDYPGYTLVPVSALAWQQATNVGWYNPDPIADAYRNGSTDVTGYKFTSTPPYKPGTLAQGGELGRLVTLLISATPRVTTRPPDPSLWAPDQAGSATTREILAALATVGLTTRPTQTDPGSGAAVQPAGPTLQCDLPVPQLQQTAYVIGAGADFPA